MSPTPEHIYPSDGLSIDNRNDEKVVVSGMSGLYPESMNVKELSEILYNKINPVNKERSRWKYEHPELCQYTGKVSGLRLFDAQFFKINFRLGNNMDPMSRKILEQAYQAIYDAGVSPEDLCGKKVGVFIGNCSSETEKVFNYGARSKTGFGIAGCSRTMFANRISYWLNLKGPSLAIDEACCSSTSALEMGYRAITLGECESAIVGGCSLCLHPQTSIHYGRSIKFSMDGKTKSFDSNATGCVKSEAINILFLQRAKDALRIYAEIVLVKSEFTSTVQDEMGQKYGFYRHPETLRKFMSDFYDEAKVPPQAVEYVEAFGSAEPEADKAELEAIEKIFCRNRNGQLLVGSVTSNIGYTEASSGISAITKVLLGYHHGMIAANLHCDSPRKDVDSLRDGRIRIVTDNETFGRSYSAVNSLSITGINAHVLLRGHFKQKDLTRYKANIPYLVTISGRQESSVKKILMDLKLRQIDPEELALFHNIHKRSISGHLGRGFTILDTSDNNKTISLCEKVNYFDDAKRPLWFLYSGMGSQWCEMGKQLMRIPVFAAAIERCHRALEPKGIDIVNIITTSDKTIFDNILNSFLGISAIQIGLTDILRAVGIVPDMIIGHSMGEQGCAYADGCLSAEEMILLAYGRGYVSLTTPFIRGSMAAVGLGYQEISKICPREIEVACHNSAQSSTISGPADVMKEFIGSLTSTNIFAKEVACSNIAYHSRYVAEAAPDLMKYLSEVVTSPKPRSERWLSTSVPQERWNDPIAKYASAEYYKNNFINPVLFEETARLIPANAVVVEIAPHGFLQAILKRSLPDSCTYIPLTRRGHPDNAQFLLEALGNLYMEGYYPKIEALYPKVEFPVSTGTPMLSHLVEWAHIEKWALPLYDSANRKAAAASKKVISLHDDESSYLRGHVVRGVILYPFAAVLVAVWDTLAMTLNVPKKQVSVQFQNVHLYAQPVLHDQKQLRLHIALHRGTGFFEVTEEKFKVATGFILADKDEKDIREELKMDDGTMQLDSDDIYQLFQLRDFNYTGDFRSIYRANMSLTEADIIWKNEWVTFIDGMIQLNALRRNNERVSQLNFIRSMKIDITKHFMKETSFINGTAVMTAKISELLDITSCGGVLIENIRFHDLPLTNKDKVQLNILQFNPNTSTDVNDGIWKKDYSLHLRENLTQGQEITLDISRFGDLNSSRWINAPRFKCSGINIKVQYMGLNEAYLNKILGVSNGKNLIAYDYSGSLERNTLVMGIALEGSISTVVRAKPEMMWPVPEYWTLEDAATVPLAYCLSFYCLFIKSKLFPGNSILVHGGAGALGQALISIALAYDCDIFTTVSDVRKKKFLLQLFPKLKEAQIGNSRDDTFYDMIMLETKGNGCNIVVNCVKGQLRNLSLKCCAECGTVIDTSLIIDNETYDFGMFSLKKALSYVTLQLNTLFDERNIDELRKIQLMMSEGIARGYVRPLSRVVYAPCDVPRALRVQASSRHRGRVLLHVQNDVPYADTQISCSPNLYQLVLADDDLTVAMLLIERLVSRGCRRLILHCDKKTNSLLFKLCNWKKQGVEVKIKTGDISSIFLENSDLNSLQGIYYVATSKILTDNTVKSLERLYLNTVKSNRIEYFTIIDARNDVTELIKIKPHIPIIIIKLPSLNNEESERLSLHSVVDAIEKALCSKEGVVVVKGPVGSTTSLLRDVATLADVSIPNQAPGNITLRDLGMELCNSKVLQTYLNNSYNVSMHANSIPSLTMETLLELECNISSKDSKETEDLGTFFSNIENDELLATTKMVVLPTLATTDVTRRDEFDANRTYLCVVPGVEGQHLRFGKLCERLKLPALVLQPSLEEPHKTIQEIAREFAKILLQSLQLNKTFYLLGYESGILIALEMASILEHHGLTGTLFCIGGGPNEVQMEFQEKLTKFQTEESLQIAVAQHMVSLMTNDRIKILASEFEVACTWKEKVFICIQKLKGNVKHSMQYAQELIQAAYARIEQVRRYKPEPKTLRSSLISILPRSMVNKNKVSSLQNYSKQKLIEYNLQSPLAYAAQDLSCAAIINRHLDNDILQEFEKKNSCETYVTNVEQFVTPVDDEI